MGETTANHKLEALPRGGSELANYQLFILGLCEALGLGRPAMAQEQNERNDYEFERRVDFKHPDGSRTAGRIDCYRRGCFILEAKQSGKRQGAKVDADQMLLIPEDATQRKPGQAKRGTRGWDQVMLAAHKQAENYSRALPVEHGYPPFLLLVDVGHVTDGLEQVRLVRNLLAKAPAPTAPDALASVFDGRNTSKRRDRVVEVLETLVATGLARTGEHEGQRRYFLPR